MVYSFEPIRSEALPNSVSIDGYMKKDDLLGPFRMDGEIVYYEVNTSPKNYEGRFKNRRSETYKEILIKK